MASKTYRSRILFVVLIFMTTVFSFGIATPAFAGRGLNLRPLWRRIVQTLEEQQFLKPFFGRQIGKITSQYLGDYNFWGIVIIVCVALGIIGAFNSESKN
jgi:hypothetical protein